MGFISCKKENEPPSQSSSNIVFVNHDIDNVTTWYKDSVYVIKTYDFYVNNTLNIQAGTVVKFHPIEGPYMMLGGSGTVIAVALQTPRLSLLHSKMISTVEIPMVTETPPHRHEKTGDT